jgi:hypothetical protein
VGLIKLSLKLGVVGFVAGFAYAAWHSAPLAYCLEAAIKTGIVATLLIPLLLCVLLFAVGYLIYLIICWLKMQIAVAILPVTVILQRLFIFWS